MLVSLIYGSQPAVDPHEAVLDFVPKAHDYNRQQGITGLLLSSPDLYLQLLEGNRTAVNALYAKIIKDKRHEKIVLLRYKELLQQEYFNWSMAYTNTEELKSHKITSVILKRTPLEVGKITGVQAAGIIRWVATQLVIHPTLEQMQQSKKEP